MNRFRIVVLLLISSVFTFLSSCHHEEDELSEPETILTLKVGVGAYLGSENWIYATNDNAEVLDAKPLTRGETVTLSSTKRLDKINVTFFQAFTNAGSRYSSFYTYAAIAKGTTWDVDNLVTYPSQPKGMATFKISDYFGPPNFLTFSNSDARNTTITQNADELMADVLLREAPGDVLLSGYRSGVPVYNWAKGVAVGDLVERNFLSDFEEFPHQVKLDFEGTNVGTVVGKNLNNATQTELINTLRLIGSEWNTDHPVIGYVDGFDAYEITVVNTKVNGWVVYHGNGDPDLSFSMPTFTFSFNKSDMLDFSFNFSQPYTYLEANWKSIDTGEPMAWGFTGPPGQGLRGFAVPDEIAKNHAIDLSKFKHVDISFTQAIEGKSYQDILPGMTVPESDGQQKYYVYHPQ